MTVFGNVKGWGQGNFFDFSVEENTTMGSDVITNGGKVTLSSSTIETKNGLLGYKIDNSSKQVKCTLSDGSKFKAGDVITLTMFASSAATTDNGLDICDGSGNVKHTFAMPAGHSKFDVYTVNYTVTAGDGIADASSFAVMKNTKTKSTYFKNVSVTGTRSVTVKAVNNGSVKVLDSNGTEKVTVTSPAQTIQVAAGEDLTFVAIPASDKYYFQRWKPTGESDIYGASTYERVIGKDLEIQAVIEHYYYVHTNASAEQGSISLTYLDGTPIPDGSAVEGDNYVKVNVTPARGYTMSNLFVSLKDESDNSVESTLTGLINGYQLQLLQDKLGKENSSINTFDVIFNAEFSQKLMSWNFTSNWTTDDLSVTSKMGGLTLEGDSWIIDNNTLRPNDKTQNDTKPHTIKIPTSQGEYVKVCIKSYSGGRSYFDINGGQVVKTNLDTNNTNGQYFVVKASDDFVTITFHYAYTGSTHRLVNNGCIKTIDIYDNPSDLLAYQSQSGNQTLYDFTSGDGFVDGMALTDLFNGKFVPETNDVRIRKKNSSWWLHNFGKSRTLTIRSLAEGQIIKLNYGNTSGAGQITFKSGNATINNAPAVANTNIVSNLTEIVATAPGSITLNLPGGTALYNINITSSHLTKDIVGGTEYFRDNEGGYGDAPGCLLMNNTGLPVTYTSTDGTVGHFYYGSDGVQENRVRFVKAGSFSVIATVTLTDGTVLSDVLPIDVVGSEATYVVNGNTYTLTGSGILAEHVVTQIPKITVQFGNDNETVVVEHKNDKYYSFVSDFQGFTHANRSQGEIPVGGSYYIFQPRNNGVLVYDAITDGGAVIKLVDGSNNAPTAHAGGGYELERNKTYYLYSTHTTQLSSFSFDATFKFSGAKSVRLSHGATSYSADAEHIIAGAAKYSVKCLGDITNATIDNSGNVTNIQGEGGAIVVTAYSNESTNDYDTDYYVINIPYGSEKTHVWDFWQYYTGHGEPYDDIKGIHFNNDENDIKARDWAVTYEVREYNEDTRELLYLNKAVFSPNVTISGNNAAYIGQTAGLLFDASPKTFGLLTSGENLIDKYKREHGGSEPSVADRDALLKQMLRYGEGDIIKSEINYGAMQRGAVLTIPNLNAGSFVAIKFYRHAPNSGDNIKITNVKGLESYAASQPRVNGSSPSKMRKAPATLTDPTVQVVNQSGSRSVENSKYGWLEFEVVADGDVTLQVTDGGWTHIKKIVTSPTFYDTDLRLVIAGHTASTRYKLPAGDGLREVVTYENSYNQHQESGKSIVFSLEDVVAPGGGTISITPGGVLSASGYGTATVIQKVYNEGTDILIDYQETPIIIIDEGSTYQDYPYTWDFANISTPTQTALKNSSDWDGDENVGFTPSSTAQTSYLQNSELCPELSDKDDTSKDINEFEGLGFRTSVDANAQTSGLNNMTIKPGTGLKIGSNDKTTIVVPKVPSDCEVFVRVAPTANTSVTLTPQYNRALGDEEDEIVVTQKDKTASDGSGNDLYSVQGQGGDVEVTVKDATVLGIGVTNIYKQCIFWDDVNTSDGHFCYHSDSHNVPIDYTLTKFYTDIEMKAYKTAAYTETDDDKYLEFAPITVAPAGDGVIVRTIDYRVDHPLFVPAINTQLSDMAGNKMIGFPDGGTAQKVKDKLNYDSNKSNCFGFTNLYGRVTDDKLGSVNVTASMPGFYRLYISDGSSLNKNLAILNLASASSSTKVIRFVFDSADVIETSVNGIDSANEIEYYTLTGIKLQSKPTEKGVYIVNGKKVLIK